MHRFARRLHLDGPLHSGATTLKPLDPWRRYLQDTTGPCQWRPEQAGLLDAAEVWLGERRQLLEQNQLPLSFEASASVTAGQLETRRYIVGVPVASLGRDPWPTVAAWLDAWEVPGVARHDLTTLEKESEIPTAIHLGLAWSDGAQGPARRLYVERRPLGAVLGGSAATAMVGSEWRPGGESTQRSYVERRPTWQVPGAGPLWPTLLRAVAEPRLQYVWDRRTARGGLADRYWHLDPTPMAQVRDALAALSGHLLGHPTGVAAWLENLPASAHLRVIGWGIDGTGQPRLKIYHTPGPLDGQPRQPSQHEALRSLAGAAVVSMRRGGQPGWLALAPVHAVAPFRPARLTESLQAWHLGAASSADLDAVIALLVASGESPADRLRTHWPIVQEHLSAQSWQVEGLWLGPAAGQPDAGADVAAWRTTGRCP